MDLGMDSRKRFLDTDFSLDAHPQAKFSRADPVPAPYIDLYGTYFMNQNNFDQQFIPQPQNGNNLLQYSQFQLQNWPQLQESYLLPQQSTSFQDQWPGPLSFKPWSQNPQHSPPEIPILSQLQLQLQIPLQFLSQRHDLFAIQRLIQLRLLMKPQHLPDPETMTSLDGLIGFNRLQIRKTLIGHESEEYKEVLKVLEKYRELHSERIDLVKDVEFPENFMVKLYYKFHEIVAKSFEIPPDDMDSYQKWMSANINYHVGFRKIGQELQRKFLGASLAEITNFKMEKMGDIRRHKEELNPMFLRGFGEVQKELLDASRQLSAELTKSWLPDWAHLPTITQPQATNLDPEKPTTSAIYYDSFGSNPWPPDPRIEQNGSSDEGKNIYVLGANRIFSDEENIEDNTIYPSSSASPGVLVATPEDPEPVSMNQIPNMEKKKELAKLTAILINLIDNTTKLDSLKYQKSEILEKIEQQEEILEEIGKERKEQKERIVELEKVKKEQEEAVITTRKEVEVAERKYQKEVKKSKKFHSKIFAPEISGNILSDASDCIDAMDEDAYNTFLFYMKSRRELKSNIKPKQDDFKAEKNELLKTEDKIKEAEEKLEELRENEEKEIEKMREQEELLENNEKETRDVENEKLELEMQRKEQEGIVEQAEREVVFTEAKPLVSDFEDEKSISSTPSPEHPPKLENEDAAINSNAMCSFDSLDSAPVLSPHYPSSSPSPSTPSPSPSPFTDSSTDVFSQLGLLPSGHSIDSEGNILNGDGEVIGTCTMNVKLFIPNGMCSAGSQ